MAGTSIVTLIGSIAAEPEVAYLQSGAMRLAVPVEATRTYEDMSGTPQQRTTRFHVVSYGKRAEALEQQMQEGQVGPGDIVFAVGRLFTQPPAPGASALPVIEVEASEFTVIRSADEGPGALSEMARVTVAGNIGRDPEFSDTRSGAKRAKFSVAVSRNTRNANGELEERTDWYSISAIGRLADTVDRLFGMGAIGKGRQVLIDGRLETSEYQDRDGNPRLGLDVQATDFQMLGTKAEWEQIRDDPRRSGGGDYSSGGSGGYGTGRSGGGDYGGRSGGGRPAADRPNPRGRDFPDNPEGMDDVPF